MIEKPSFIRNFLMAGLWFGILFGVPFGLLVSFVAETPFFSSILLCAVPAGLLFGFSLASFGKAQASPEKIAIDLTAGETLRHAGPANHFAGREARGGYLYLTDKRLIFRPHAVNIHTHPFEVPVQDITSVTPSRTLGLVPNGIVVSTRSAGDQRFVVQSRRKWLDRIGAEIQ